MSKRINIVLPDKTVAVLNRVTSKGSRSRFIDRAVRRLVEVEGKANLRQQLKEEAIANAGRDLEFAAEWFPLDEEAWHSGMASKRPSRKAVRRRRA